MILKRCAGLLWHSAKRLLLTRESKACEPGMKLKIIGPRLLLKK